MNTEYKIGIGTLRPYLHRHTPWFMEHFDRAVIDRNIPILTDERRAEVQAIVDRLNAGELTIEQALAEINQ